jgi:GH25 family lysozyme M1 (1,4-beta-N-acetylmuramidase)
MINGIDVSLWQGAIKWDVVKSAGYHFAFIRSSLGARIDANFVQNFHSARTAGLLAAPYHVVYPGISAYTQLATLRSLLPTTIDFPIVLDIEVNPAADTLDAAKQMVSALQQQHLIIYTGAWWWDPATKNIDVTWAAIADLWLASYTTNPIMPKKPWNSWKMWQYSETGRVPGISGNVDLNRFNGTLDDLTMWWRKSMTTATVQLTAPARIYVGEELLLQLESVPCNDNPAPIIEGIPLIDSFRLPMLNIDKAWYEATRVFGRYNFHPERCEDWNLESGGNTDLGEPLVAPFNGLVLAARNYGGAIGRVVQLLGRTVAGEMIVWAGWHMQEMFCTAGQVVLQGDLIGSIGNADGYYAGAHLHEQICIAGNLGVPSPSTFASNSNYAWQQPSAFYLSRGVPAALIDRVTKMDGR